MRHLTFYYAIGFLIVGFLMLFIGLSTFIGRISRNDDLAGSTMLGLAMLLPFVIAELSWQDWGIIQKEKDVRESESKVRALKTG